MPVAPLSPPDGRADRRGVRWDAFVAAALGLTLLVGGGLDVRTYLSGRGKSQPAFRLLNASVGQRIRLHEFFQESSTVVHLGNVGRVEWDNPQDDRTKFRWALGPVSLVEIWSDRAGGRIELRLRNPYPDQTITVACNGRTLEEIHLEAHEEITRRYPLEFHPGSNQFTLSFARYRPPGTGERTLAARFLLLDLYLSAPDGKL